jgi:hypothetical protein
VTNNFPLPDDGNDFMGRHLCSRCWNGFHKPRSDHGNWCECPCNRNHWQKPTHPPAPVQLTIADTGCGFMEIK